MIKRKKEKIRKKTKRQLGLNNKFSKFSEQLIAKDGKDCQEENRNNNVFYSQFTVFSQYHRIEITNLQKQYQCKL